MVWTKKIKLFDKILSLDNVNIDKVILVGWESNEFNLVLGKIQ